MDKKIKKGIKDIARSAFPFLPYVQGAAKAGAKAAKSVITWTYAKQHPEDYDVIDWLKEMKKSGTPTEAKRADDLIQGKSMYKPESMSESDRMKQFLRRDRKYLRTR